ncbi:hypothetical protein HZC53_03240 [Candidatus Uhrbacteria bacterium]|nr:hypothetical protein [Candidatus Uhrbacteria bacterium]
MKRKVRTAAKKNKTPPVTHADRLEQLRIMVWAALTMTSFMVAYIASQLMGAISILPFVFGGTAMIIVMLFEAFLRGRIWIFEPGFRETFGKPDISYRVLIFCGICLLLLESYVLMSSYASWN